MNNQQNFDEAREYHRTGQLSEAEVIYRKILTTEAGHADALYFLGRIAKERGTLAEATELIEQWHDIGNVSSRPQDLAEDQIPHGIVRQVGEDHAAGEGARLQLRFGAKTAPREHSGDPIDALETLTPFLKQCHIKDATKTREPGTWGAEVTVGTGEVDWPTFFATLTKLGYDGDCCIEREADDQRVADIRTAREFVTQL